MNLEEIFATLQALLALDAKCAAVPFLGQIATAVADAPAVREYNKNLEAALSGIGLAFVAVVAEGEMAAQANAAAPILDLENVVILSVIENPKQNETGETGFQYVRRALRVLHRGTVNVRRTARVEVKLGKPAFNVGPLNKGTTVYFINLSVRTTEDLGALTPV